MGNSMSTDDCGAMFDALEIEFQNLMNRAIVEKTKYFGEHKARSNRPDERSAYCFPGQKCHPTLVQAALLQNSLVGSLILCLLAGGYRFPHF